MASTNHQSSWSRQVSLLLSGLALLLAFFWFMRETSALGMKRSMPMWVIDAIPPALSEAVCGHTKRYTALESVHEELARAGNSEEAVNAAIARVVSRRDQPQGEHYVLLGSDDKGIVDFVRIAFRLFGYRVSSVYHLYFALLFVSTMSFAVAFRRSPHYLALAAAILVMATLISPMIAFNGQTTSILALRVFPVLSMIATLHCLLSVLDGPLNRERSLWFLLQTLLIIFVVHIRSTALWQVQILGLVCFFVLARQVWRSSEQALVARMRQCVVLGGGPLLIVVAAYCGLQAYRAQAYPEEYKRGDQIATRVMWHNVFSGLAFNPALARDLQLRIDDVSIIRATGVYLNDQHRAQDWESMGGLTKNYSGVRWTEYDLAVRDMFLHTCRHRPVDCFLAAAYYKPRSLVGHLAWLFGLRSLPPNLHLFTSPDVGAVVADQVVQATKKMNHQGVRQGPWAPMPLLLMGLFLIPFAHAARRGPAVVAAVALFSGSLVPVLVGYPATHTIAEPAISAGTLFYLACLVGLVWIGERARRFRRFAQEADAVTPIAASSPDRATPGQEH